MLSTDSASMLLLLLAVCLWRLVKKQAELFRFPLCPDFVVSVSDGRLSTRCYRQPVISLVRGAGSEGLSLTVLTLAYEEEKKNSTPHSPYCSPPTWLCGYYSSYSPGEFPMRRTPCAPMPQSETMSFKIMTTMLQQDTTRDTQVSHQNVAFASPLVSRPHSNFLPCDSHVSIILILCIFQTALMLIHHFRMQPGAACRKVCPTVRLSTPMTLMPVYSMSTLCSSI